MFIINFQYTKNNYNLEVSWHILGYVEFPIDTEKVNLNKYGEE